MRRRALPSRLLACCLLWVGIIAAATATDDAAKGLAIAEEADRRDDGWGDERATLEMVLRNRQGQESRRTLDIAKLEVADDGDRSLTVFDTPRDVAGTALLTYSHALTPDDQWLYLPALKRVKRIASANTSAANSPTRISAPAKSTSTPTAGCVTRRSTTAPASSSNSGHATPIRATPDASCGWTRRCTSR